MYDTGSILEVVDLLAHFMIQQERSSTPTEIQSWGLVIDMAAAADTPEQLRRALTKSMNALGACSYRRVLRIALAHVEEACITFSAHAVL